MPLPLRHLALLCAFALVGLVVGVQGQTLASGEVLALHLEAGTVQVLEVEVPNHRRISIAASAEAFSPLLTLHLPGGAALTAQGGQAITHINCCRATTLRLSVRSTRSTTGGAYSISMHATDLSRVDTGVPLQAGDRVEGRLAPGDLCKTSGAYTDPYLLQGVAGESLMIDMTSEDFDPFIQVKCPCGQAIEDDDSGTGLNARMFYRFHETGTHRIDATSLENRATGDYTLEIKRP